jgi:two-component system, LytTR family, sensor histidine kinase AlgZ
LKVSLHPVLSRREYFAAYAGVWAVLALLFIILIHTSGGIGLTEAIVLLGPMLVLYAAIGLSAWYVCKATPLRTARDVRVFATHLTAGFALSFIWMQVGSFYARLLWRSAHFRGIEERYASHQTILLVGGVLLYLLTVGFFYVVLAIEASREAESRAAQTTMLARDAELRALRAQINPHFLFNSLNSISALTSIDGTRAREMCLLLADFLRLTLGLGEKNVIPFLDELDLLEKFLAIEKVRFGARLRMEESIAEDAKRCMMPALLLQPLLENAISHGIASMADGGLIRLEARVQDGRMVIAVENDRDEEAPSRKRSGVGLRNVRSRLEARYGNEATFRIEPGEDRFRVSMSFPAEYGAAEAGASK